ncbi:DUF3990 domain-containing protein [Pseudobutyrivibrio xylanivorans]|uniref:DUF3990 domain-containing protein n=1 Tax=Pseudobutyrivibrio xylanivorans TaxID=185007 RepID=A0A5P6VSF0_PSEXY|nr:DUF3990 domain-containing protein [Pseudobutyrivibrio xylanivorans]QFJ55380.1 DUF3990 domain-containing protein [Pseudobutyrivibrio xylanivorans]
MDNIILYHGSERIIEKPKYKEGNIYNDYGQGFYCTKHIELAKEWAVDDERAGFVNSYEVNLEGLKVLDLNGSEYSILNWLTVLLEHRNVKISNPVALDGLEYLKKKYYVDIEEYDVIVGYRADDSYFSFARAFVSNSISISQLEKAMYLGELGTQYFIKSEKAFSRLKFIEANPVDYIDYYPKRMSRDTIARNSYNEISNTLDKGGVYILDLMREES